MCNRIIPVSAACYAVVYSSMFLPIIDCFKCRPIACLYTYQGLISLFSEKDFDYVTLIHATLAI